MHLDVSDVRDGVDLEPTEIVDAQGRQQNDRGKDCETLFDRQQDDPFKHVLAPLSDRGSRRISRCRL